MPPTPRIISSILIANRGEIALRVIRACKELGIRSIAIYSDADREARHTRTADVAISIGGLTPAESYLDHDKVLNAATMAGCDAIHPGYGFLSENPVFAEKVEKAGLIFIGPSSAAIRLLGDKMSAKALAHRVGVPTAGGSNSPVSLASEAAEIALRVGYPILIKAAAGGGGKGMRTVEKAEDLETSIAAAQREAKGAFGDDRVFVEKLIQHPRHIEFQILADAFGNVIHCGERECSVQRRHQKVVEESPSMLMTPELRKDMGEAACRIIREAGYTNAGTVEFLVDNKRNFYFLEVNTRLQVEHPVTEMVTGIDLVHQQIAIARNEPLDILQTAITQHGWAIECRIMAEDPFNEFLPGTGRIATVVFPEGPCVRLDTALCDGQEISPYYDSMLGKLIVWGKSREEAVQRCRGALSDFLIGGIATSIPFCTFVLNHPAFVSGTYTTSFVAEALQETPLVFSQDMLEAAVAAAIYATEESRVPVNLPTSRWRSSQDS